MAKVPQKTSSTFVETADDEDESEPEKKKRPKVRRRKLNTDIEVSASASECTPKKPSQAQQVKPKHRTKNDRQSATMVPSVYDYQEIPYVIEPLTQSAMRSATKSADYLDFQDGARNDALVAKDLVAIKQRRAPTKKEDNAQSIKAIYRRAAISDILNTDSAELTKVAVSTSSDGKLKRPTRKASMGIAAAIMAELEDEDAEF